MKIIDRTPKSADCVIGACPAIFETDRDTYLVIGIKLSQEEIFQILEKKIEPNEAAIELPKKLLETALNIKGKSD